MKEYLASGRIDFANSFVIGDARPTCSSPRTWASVASATTRRRVAGSPSVINCSQGRTAEVERYTKETRIQVAVDLDKSGGNQIATGIGFFDHMLDQIATHAGFRLRLKVSGDLHRRSPHGGRRRAGAGPGPAPGPWQQARHRPLRLRAGDGRGAGGDRRPSPSGRRRAATGRPLP